ncbi:thiol-disulfide isomerase/thioredoxin [Haloferula luteola]|uniref:Thiol-disulfide isomerase/thioredoxin n=1 Tax=Haloferula luteola TaxID=595692 RepID=A0A840UX94_9BACT|nr:TlpA disulfide reductase family protein [Haloferula luteola]MBB5350777.1 thiol-disulfide isomerase/thioredoxin [Haloferula luteola]
MKCLHRSQTAPLLALWSLCLIPAGLAQKVGDSVTPDALQKADWVQGEAPTAWEPGKLYLIECWATWCGPCIAAIPHVDELFDKYASQGLRVIGMNVWEDGREKVAKFVADKGEGMSYPVAYTGRNGAFETDWLKPAEVRGIPHGFLVRDGKVIGMGHPSGFTDEVIGTLLKGGDAAQAALDELQAKAQQQQAVAAARAAWSEASKAQDPVAMKAAADQLEAASPGDLYLPLLRNETLIAAKDFDSLEKRIEEWGPEDSLRPLILTSLARSIEQVEDLPESTSTKLIAAYEAMVSEQGNSANHSMLLARLKWKAGDEDAAKEDAARAGELANDPSNYLPSEPYQKFAESMKTGTMPSHAEFTAWMQAAMKAAREKKEAEKKS